jgi:exodeoxyribonuclease VII large subunit
MDKTVISVSEFVALINQTLEYAYPFITVEGEVSEFRVSKGKWVYFNLQDDNSSVRMFGSVFNLQQPIEDGMKVVVKGSPRLHNKYGFSLNISTIRPSGEGSIKKAFELLKKKLAAEGLFAPERKRPIPEVPQRIGLITSGQAAAYSDFLTILNERWVGVDVLHADVQVQGDPASGQIVRAIDYFAQMADPVDVLVLTRGGGSSEDLMAFSTEEVARAVAGSRIPTIVGVGHEIDVSLADMAADVRATTPTNAAQLVVPNKQDVMSTIDSYLDRIADRLTGEMRLRVQRSEQYLVEGISRHLDYMHATIDRSGQVLELVNPKHVLRRGYSLLTTADGRVISKASQLSKGDVVGVQLHKGSAKLEVKDVDKK